MKQYTQSAGPQTEPLTACIQWTETQLLINANVHPYLLEVCVDVAGMCFKYYHNFPFP